MQCFSTFWASSPGWRQILTSLSRSLFFKVLVILIWIFNHVFLLKCAPKRGLLELHFQSFFWLNSKMLNLEIFKVSKSVQVPVRRFLSSGTGMRPGGWETLNKCTLRGFILRKNIIVHLTRMTRMSKNELLLLRQWFAFQLANFKSFSWSVGLYWGCFCF